MSNLILTRGEIVRIRVKRGHLRVTCRTGRLWATSDRDGIDTLLVPGESVTYTDRGTVVVEALRIAALRLDDGEAAHVEHSAPGRARIGLHSLRAAVQ